ncbi:RNA polymerase II-associated protein [Trichinella spiralis]|uniref:RNA polymerase II-associated protein n=1 Tax=Trichinella spiralis TaxID=6334 RepID=A0ABR3KJ45_TRISP
MLVRKERKDISEKDAQKALFEKESGNSFYVKKDYEKAIMCYSRSISADPFRPVVYCNRAMAYLKLKNYAEAYADCSKALTFDSTYVKALYRRGMASKGLNNFDDAVEDFQHVLTLDPNNDIAKKELEEIISKVKPAENDPLLVYPVENPDEKEYQKPLKVIIVRDAVKKSQFNSQHPALSDESNVTKQSEQKISDYKLNASIKITRIPKCYAELRADWISIKEEPLALADYILNIPCDCFSNLLGEFLDGEFVANLLKAFMIKVNSEPQCSISCMERLELIGKQNASTLWFFFSVVRILFIGKLNNNSNNNISSFIIGHKGKGKNATSSLEDNSHTGRSGRGSVVLASPEAAESYVAEQRLQLQAGKLQRIAVLTVPSQLPLLYSSPRAPGISETNYITCIFESTAAKVVEVVDDIRHELSRWISINDMVTVCCELSWSVPVDQRDVNCEKEVKQALLKHMRANQDRVASMTAALYHAKGWLKAVPDKTPVSNIQEQCRTVGGTVNGCYRRIYDTLIPLVHSQARDMHQSYWALTMDRPLQSHVPTTPNRSVYALNLICITVERSDHFTLLSLS